MKQLTIESRSETLQFHLLFLFLIAMNRKCFGRTVGKTCHQVSFQLAPNHLWNLEQYTTDDKHEGNPLIVRRGPSVLQLFLLSLNQV